VPPAWWRSLCRDWVEPRLREQAGRHPAETTTRARALVDRAAGLPATDVLLGELSPTLLHGDVHPGNVLVDDGQATLIDWGNARIGPAALDLANLVTADSASVARYARTREQLTGQPLPAAVIDLGYRWAALQIPVQYLPWTIAHRSTREADAVLDQIEQALESVNS
jgi:aminoglycoside phosphotransferase (APT) family kinase protein